ncbi:MAG: hypothetical protein IJG64_03900 [Oscillospiraceae bacterium]|nr:hypothetical protein [Oscillospiraceae bacterium]
MKKVWFGNTSKFFNKDDGTVQINTPVGSFMFPLDHEPDPIEMEIMLKSMGVDMSMTNSFSDPFTDNDPFNGFGGNDPFSPPGFGNNKW